VREQVSQRQQILHSKARPPAAQAEVGIGGNNVRPIDRHGSQPSVGMLEGDAILSPERLGDYKPKALAPERMKRMRDPNLRWISGTSGS
jgi:hypothetical protein